MVHGVRRNTYHGMAAVSNDTNALLDKFFTEQLAKAEALDPAYQELWDSMRRLTTGGGKRLRPYMTVLAYEVYGGQNHDGVIYVAAAQELLHVALLIHDDIADKDYVRRGRLNIAGEYRQRYAVAGESGIDVDHFANASALLAGDLALSAAHTIIFDSPLPLAEQALALRILSKATFAVAAGQLLDMEAVLGSMDDSDPVKIARLKTASYSFIGPLQSGAALAGAPANDMATLEIFGDAMGLAYQLTDDLLGVFGDEAKTGKSASNDIREGKRTYLMQQAFRLANDEQRAVLRQHVGKSKLSAEQVAAVRAAVRACGAERATEQAVEAYGDQARQALRKLTIPADAAELLEAVLLRIVRRDG